MLKEQQFICTRGKKKTHRVKIKIKKHTKNELKIHSSEVE